MLALIGQHGSLTAAEQLVPLLLDDHLSAGDTQLSVAAARWPITTTLPSGSVTRATRSPHG